jgi:putative membrane protein
VRLPDRFRTVLDAALRGLAIGAADVVPGVSGGTMALVLGIYERLLAAIAAFTRAPLRTALRAGRPAAAWRAIDGDFLLGVVLGVACSVIALAGVIELALERERASVYALFFGLVAASIPVVAGVVRRWRAGVIVAGGVAALTAAAIVTVAAPIAAPQGALFLAASGAIGITALLLPGVSGAFLLVLLGQYDAVIGAIARGDLAALAPFALGAGVGLLAFARLIGVVLRRAPDAAHAALAGFLLGSLPRVWPWQGEGERLALLPPPDAIAAALAIGLAATGVALVRGLRRRAAQRRG